MKVMAKLIAGAALAFGLSHAANAAVIPLATPGVVPQLVWTPDLGCTDAGCHDEYTFSLPVPTIVELSVGVFGDFGSYDWSFERVAPDSLTLIDGNGGAFSPFAPILGFGPTELGVGTYTFFMNLYNGNGITFLQVVDDVKVASNPIPGALLLFGSGLAGLGFAGRRSRKKTAATAKA